jgi:hypothetical protein
VACAALSENYIKLRGFFKVKSLPAAPQKPSKQDRFKDKQYIVGYDETA